MQYTICRMYWTKDHTPQTTPETHHLKPCSHTLVQHTHHVTQNLAHRLAITTPWKLEPGARQGAQTDP